ncbi:MAG: hypothetical protein AB8B82_02135 [Roseovarius sp.]
MTWRVLCSVLCLLWPVLAMADTLPPKQVELFTAFAQDVSGADPQIMALAQKLTSTPPTTKEDIGFYGLDDAPPAERALRGIIRALSDAGHLITVEDKYLFELPEILEAGGAAKLPADRSRISLLAPFEKTDWDAGVTDAEWLTFKGWFPGHVRAIEQAVHDNGRSLLSLRLPLGDTLYYWAAVPEMADKWRDTALYAGVNTLEFKRTPVVSISISDPDWATYWGFATYALGVPEAHWPTPDGL